jgi:serine-type D-Ala-D-Ala carboxypeptidase/endopeptidase (penicillin-binding protein 4)
MSVSFLIQRFLSLKQSAIVLGLFVLSSGCQSPQPSASGSAQPSPVVKPEATLTTFPSQPLTVALSSPTSILTPSLNTFLQGTIASKSPQQSQGVWIQTNTQLLANYQGTTPLSAASLTKAATSLAALQTLGPNYRFVTKVGTTGPIKNGVLNGDLVIQGGQDPFFVWEDAIALAAVLQQQGIRQIKGNLAIAGPFYMNFESNPTAAGTFLQQGLDSTLWPAEALQQFQALPPHTAKPQLKISGTVIAKQNLPANVQWIAQHQSFPLADLLKKMNRYSNNPMADMMAKVIGGASVVAQKAIAATGVPASEIQLVNGSGLAVENQMSPRAVCALFLAINKLVRSHNMTVADIFTVIGTDESVLDQRPLPKQAVLKSGTLDTVSALGGALPTRQGGVVWFALLNNQGNVETFRNLQEKLLNTLQQNLGSATSPLELMPTQPSSTGLSHTQLWTHPNLVETDRVHN